MRYIFFLSAIELSLMGSGQAISYKGFSLRMVLFAILVTYSFFKIRWSVTIIRNSILFISLLIVGFLIGMINNASTSHVLIDIKPLLFIFYIAPISFFLQDNDNRNIVIRIIKISSIVLAIIYLLYVVLFLFFPVIRLIPMYLVSYREIYFRPSGLFFYKGFLTLMVGFILHLYSNSKFRLLICTILLSAIILSLTRGILAALLGSFIFLFWIDLWLEKRISKTRLILFPVILIILVFSISSILLLYGDRTVSDAIRFQIIDQVFENINAFSLILGHGFGIGIEVRELHMEIAYLEILHKQGVLGLSFWILIFIQAFLYYRNSMRSRRIAKPFFLIVCSVYLISFTNSFVNNPLGLYPLLVSLICLKIISEEDFSMHTNV